jgi:hypothetical protein
MAFPVGQAKKPLDEISWADGIDTFEKRAS